MLYNVYININLKMWMKRKRNDDGKIRFLQYFQKVNGGDIPITITLHLVDTAYTAHTRHLIFGARGLMVPCHKFSREGQKLFLGSNLSANPVSKAFWRTGFYEHNNNIVGHASAQFLQILKFLQMMFQENVNEKDQFILRAFGRDDDPLGMKPKVYRRGSDKLLQSMDFLPSCLLLNESDVKQVKVRAICFEVDTLRSAIGAKLFETLLRDMAQTLPDVLLGLVVGYAWGHDHDFQEWRNHFFWCDGRIFSKEA